jgi:hypothetical protein
MGLRRYVFLSGLCVLILLLSTRNIIIGSVTVREITAAINELESRSTTILLQQVQHSLPWCTRNEIRVGSWKPQILDSPPYNPRTVHLMCYPENEYKNKTTKWTHTYEWQPTAAEDCVFSNWNRDEFCNLMKRATILIIGDSLSFEHYRSLGHLMGKHISQLSQHKSKKEQDNIVNYVCQKQTRIVYRRDDLLSNVSQAIFEGGSLSFPQVIVMNRGAHYQNDTMLMTGMKKVVEELQNWKLQCETFNITCHLLWRTSVPGHPNCEKRDFRGPVNDLHAMEAMISDRSNYNNRTIKYQWYNYQHQNEMVVDMLTTNPSFLQQDKGTSPPFFLEIIDAYYLNILRPDEHRAHQEDCLHSCYPGPPDVYSQLLLHFLQIQRGRTDIDSLIAWQDKYHTKTNI